MPVSRSYDGHVWESVFPLPIQPLCDSSGCRLKSETGRTRRNAGPVASDAVGFYRIDTTSHGGTTKEQAASRLLEQGTFGATRTSIAGVLDGRDGSSVADEQDKTYAAEWIGSQLQLPPTLLRQRYRRRAIPRVEARTFSGGITSPCDAGARFNRFAINGLDVGREFRVVVAPQKQRFEVYVNNVLRSEMPTFMGVSASDALDNSSRLDACMLEFANSNPPYRRQYCGSRLCGQEILEPGFGNPDLGKDALMNVYDYWAKRQGSPSFRARPDECDAAVSAAASSEGLIQSICQVVERVNGFVYSHPDPEECKSNRFLRSATADMAPGYIWTMWRNPAISFSSHDSTNTQVYDVGDITLKRVTQTAATSDSYVSIGAPSHCTGVGEPWSFIGVRASALAKPTYYVHEGRIRLIENSLEAPADDAADDYGGSDGACPAVEKTFLNSESCQRRDAGVCSPLRYTTETLFPLDTAALRTWFTESTLYVYEVRGLRLDQSASNVPPCDPFVRSRWIRTPGVCTHPTGLHGTTKAVFEAALTAAGLEQGSNQNIRDVVASDFTAAHGGECVIRAEDTDKTGRVANITLDGDCWSHSHPDERNVYDFTNWANVHPGNVDAARANRKNPIVHFADDGDSVLVFPFWHPMSRWDERSDQTRNNRYFEYIGRSGDRIDFALLPVRLQTAGMAAYTGAVSSQDITSFEACGSRGEVSNDPTLSNSYLTIDKDNLQGFDTFHDYRFEGAGMNWLNVVLHSDDQLRQRVAWALSQIIVAGQPDFAFESDVELWAHFYDNFVANALGNYRDILMEVSVNPVMGRYLSFSGNVKQSGGRFPDENYAREIMQLFSIGIWELNIDGTQKLDAAGEPIPSYDNDDVVAFARAWTGWSNVPNRGNIASENEAATGNYIDPMTLKPDRRDDFPKTALPIDTGGYLGDGYPLCSNLPPRHFLLEGAAYRNTGEASVLGAAFDVNSANKSRETESHFSPAPSSGLYRALCAPDGAGRCTFPSDVKLATTVPCEGTVECSADTLRAVEVVDPVSGKTNFYVYVEPVCTRLFFFDDGKFIQYRNNYQCTDPNIVGISGLQCCNASRQSARHYASNYHEDTKNQRYYDGVISDGGKQCLYLSEAMKFGSAESRCAAIGGVPCHDGKGDEKGTEEDGTSVNWQSTCGGWQYAWTSKSCTMQVQIHSTGEVSLVDDTNPLSTERWATAMHSALKIHSGNNFRVRWNTPTDHDADASTDEIGQRPAFPTLLHDNNCTLTGCYAIEARGGSCICEFSVDNTAVYTDPSVPLPEPARLRTQLKVASMPPNTFGPTAYTLCTSVRCLTQPEVKVWTKGLVADPVVFDSNTIFELNDVSDGNYGTRFTKYLQNLVSTVFVGSPERKITVIGCDASSNYSDIEHRNGGKTVRPCSGAHDGIHDGSDKYGWLTGYRGRLWPADEPDREPWIRFDFVSAVEVDRFDYMGYGGGFNYYESSMNKYEPTSTRWYPGSYGHYAARNFHKVRLEFSDGTNETLTLDNSNWLEPTRHHLAATHRTTYVKLTALDIDAPFCGESGIDTAPINVRCGMPYESRGIKEITFFAPGNNASTRYSFRNPPNFMPNVGDQTGLSPAGSHKAQGKSSSDAHAGKISPFGTAADPDRLLPHARHETEALLTHLFEHHNTAPFLALRLIQRMVSSNPSPRYIQTVAAAFTTGSYDAPGLSFSGRYGDLAAMTAAVLLDQEARSATLMADSQHGSLREPLLKVIQLMRSMEFKSKNEIEVHFNGMQKKIGQNAFKSPSVFGFYNPEFSPAGAVGDAGLVSPEAQLATAPLTVGFLNGVSSLIKFGLHSCQHGFGDGLDNWRTEVLPRESMDEIFIGGFRSSRSCTDKRGIDGGYSPKTLEYLRAHNDGQLEFTPTTPSDPGKAVEEIGTLLTPGRLSSGAKQLISEEYENILATEKLDLRAATARMVKKYEHALARTHREGYTHCNDSRIYLPASNAIDGFGIGTDGAMGYDAMVACRGTCTQTVGAESPWWEVDLGAEYEVVSVRITRRLDSGSGALDGIDIYVSSHDVDTGDSDRTLTEYTNLGGGKPLLGECAGDCDNDGDCAGDLKCYHRETHYSTGDQPTPGCNGTAGSSSYDYCFRDLQRKPEGTGRLCAAGVPLNSFSSDDYNGRGEQMIPCAVGAVGSVLRIELGDNAYRAQGKVRGGVDSRGRPITLSISMCGVEVFVRKRSVTGVYPRDTHKEAAAVRRALSLFSVLPEFHATGLNTPARFARMPPVSTPASGHPYKSVVVLYLGGGADSFSFLIPHSGCSKTSADGINREYHDLYAEYAAVRGEDVAIPNASLAKTLLNNVKGQPCNTMALHPSFKFLKAAYDAGDAAFVANAGALVHPMTVAEYDEARKGRGTKKLPPSLFAHNIMTRSAQNVHANNPAASGILGRMVKKLSEGGGSRSYKTAQYSINGYAKILEGAETPAQIDDQDGVVRFVDYQSLKDAISNLTSQRRHSVYAETFEHVLTSTLLSTETLGNKLENTSLPLSDPPILWPGSGLARQLTQVAKIMRLDKSDFGTERAGFFVNKGGWDSHNVADISDKVADVDASLDAFVKEMKHQGHWEDTTVVVLSEFGRTLTGNSQGTDHAWGGNYFVLGGSVKGGQVLGKYPERLVDDANNVVNIGRGRVLPTTPWESIWEGVADWFGVDRDGRDEIMPNKRNFPKEVLFEKDVLYE